MYIVLKESICNISFFRKICSFVYLKLFGEKNLLDTICLVKDFCLKRTSKSVNYALPQSLGFLRGLKLDQTLDQGQTEPRFDLSTSRMGRFLMVKGQVYFQSRLIWTARLGLFHQEQAPMNKLGSVHLYTLWVCQTSLHILYKICLEKFCIFTIESLFYVV